MKNIIKIPINTSVLVVEDNLDRIDWFKKKLIGTYAVSPSEAVQLVQNTRFDLVFLDHDAVPSIVNVDDPEFFSTTFFKVAETSRPRSTTEK